ncbi:MAG: SDR family oxidoreductase [Chloroflexi bacterium]|nr:SDR family oxidoreductase [Chloroflexota bacterium]
MSSNNSGKKFLVIGATGIAGGEVARGLLARGESVRALARDAEKAQPLKDLGAEVAVGDLSDPSTLGPAFDGIDSVFLVTGIVDNAAQNGASAIDASKIAGVSHLVRYSAIGGSLDSPVALGRDHAQTELDVKESGIPYTILRTQTYMQNLLVAAATIASDGAIHLPYRDGRVGMVDVRDIGIFAVELLVRGGEIGKTYTITGPESIDLHQAASAISDAIGKDVNYVDIPPEAAQQALLGFGLSEWLVNQYLAYFEEFASGAADFISDDFEQLMGRKPLSVAEFARDHAVAFSGESAAV